MAASKQKPNKSRRNSKKSKTAKANQKMWTYLIVLVLMIFSFFRLGLFGMFLYNLVRLFVGSLAILAMLVTFGLMVFSLVRKKIFAEHKRKILLVTGLFFVGIMLVYHAQFDHTYGANNTLDMLLSDMRHSKVTQFMGAGMIGYTFYFPLQAIFSTIGVYIIAVLLWVAAIFIGVPNFFRNLYQSIRSSLSDRENKHQQKLKEQEEQKKQEAYLQQEQPYVPIAEQLTTPDQTENEILIDIPSVETYPNYDENEINEGQDDFSFDTESFNYEGIYQLPKVDLLADIPIKDQSTERETVHQNISILEDTFKSFGISATVESAVVGPAVTKYEIKLATGVKVSRILNLSDDLALALAAKDVRIEAPIPGKSLVGVEIPNSQVATVGFKELWQNGKTDPNKFLEIPLGKSLDGGVRTFDLSRMPHLLVAGSTGSGKSVAVNGIITSILMKALPSQVKFLMVDPKMVELSVYNDIPHLLIPVVTNPRKAARALQKVVDEMENRYELFSGHGVRNIEGYNAKVEKYNAQSDEKMIPLPLIVVIVDELADLMMVASKEVEDAIIRLGQKARAAGIHMILATQRPSVDVISGLIKANVPSRVAFAVSSGTDSRTILDANGAEKLLGRGDMLFKPIDENHPVRLQGAFLSDEDVESVVDFIKSQAQADYDENFDPGEIDENSTESNGVGGSGDPLFEEAKNLVVVAQKASTSQLQRALKVGFNRATDLMNELESAGVVGPAKGTTPRKVLISGQEEPDEDALD